MKVDHELFRTGVPAIDRQHEHYIELSEGALALCAVAQPDPAALAAAVNQALRYAREHFDTEEGIMRAAAYPLLRQHAAKHDLFRAQAARLADELAAGAPAADFAARLAKLLVDWFAAQVQTDYLRLALFLKQPANAKKFEALLR